MTGDIEQLATFVRRWIAANDRHTSPKVLAGESYGGFRLPRLAYTLQSNQGIGVSALIVISPVLDFGMLRGRRDLPMSNVGILPSLAATALEAQGKTPSPETMRDVESYAKGEFLADLMRGARDKDAAQRIIKKVAGFTGLPEEVVRRYGGRLDGAIYRREANQPKGLVASPYDASVTGIDQDPTALFSRADDPFSTALTAPMTSAMLELYANRLNWRPEGRYRMFNREVNSGWAWGNSTSPPESMSQLRSALALDPKLAVLVGHGYTDHVTPYFTSTMLLDQLPDYGGNGRVRSVTYPGGHMFYSRDASRTRFRDDVKAVIEAAVK